MNNRNIYIRYGETVTIAVTTADLTTTGGTFYAAKSGEAPVIEKAFTFTDGAGVIELLNADTSIALGEYNYSVVIDGVELPNASSGTLPQLVVRESVKYDENGVS